MEDLAYELFAAMSEGNTVQISQLLQKGAPMNFELFAKATQEKNYNSLGLFLDHGCDINAASAINSGIPPALVHTFDDIELAEWFLKHGADTNKQYQMRDATPLPYAVLNGPLDIIDLFFQYGRSTENGQLLHFASMRCDGLVILEYLRTKNPSIMDRVNSLLDEGYPEYGMNYRFGLCTPIQYAACAGSLGSVRFLIEQGGDPWRLDPYRRTALSYAVYYQHKSVEKYLRDLRNQSFITA